MAGWITTGELTDEFSFNRGTSSNPSHFDLGGKSNTGKTTLFVKIIREAKQKIINSDKLILSSGRFKAALFVAIAAGARSAGTAHTFAVPAPLGHSHPAAAAPVICPSRAAPAR